jgi:hypothetical protein
MKSFKSAVSEGHAPVEVVPVGVSVVRGAEAGATVSVWTDVGAAGEQAKRTNTMGRISRPFFISINLLPLGTNNLD